MQVCPNPLALLHPRLNPRPSPPRTACLSTLAPPSPHPRLASPRLTFNLTLAQEKELAHARLGMIAAAGFLAQEAVTKTTWAAADGLL